MVETILICAVAFAVMSHRRRKLWAGTCDPEV